MTCSPQFVTFPAQHSLLGTIFLSYAREDADAARRVAEALRGQGMEVWFDQNELVGGDAWDQKIRRQIRECTVFVPLISAHTNARAEGYFRREWKQAVERTHDMADDMAFLLPVVIDDTADAAARVPEKFREVQWTRLPGGEATPAFVQRVQSLLGRSEDGFRPGAASSPEGGQRTEAGGQKSEARSQRSEDGGASSAEVGRALRARPLRMAIAAIGVLLAVVAGVVFLSKNEPAARRSAPPTPGTSPTAAAKPPPDLAAKSVAVLPFTNLSPDPENAFFADGVHEDVITNLAKIHDLKVISRTSVLTYRGAAPGSLRKIAAELGVATILEGSVRRAGNKVRVTAQLIDARTDEHLWAETYDGDLSDVFELQSALAQKIAAELNATLTASERALIQRRLTKSQSAYDLYVRARLQYATLTYRTSREKREEVVALYEQASAQDPAFILPYVSLTSLHAVMYASGSVDPTPERRARAQAAMETVRRLAPEAPETRLAQGDFAGYCDNDWPRALTEFRAAEAGLANDPSLFIKTGVALWRLGRWQDAVGYVERSTALNPHDLNVGAALVAYVWFLRRYPQVHQLAGRYLALFPNDGLMQTFLIASRFQLDGDRTAYLEALAVLTPMDDDPQGLQKAYEVAMRAGDYAAAARTLEDPRLTTFPNARQRTVVDPVALHRALVAFLRGQRAAAQTSADEAIAFYHTQSWTPRQEPLALLGIAQAEAYSGRVDEAVRDAQAALGQVAGRDAEAELWVRFVLTRIYAALDRREEALADLREVLRGPCVWWPSDIRFDPLLSRLKDDPRFEEILKAAKPL